MATVRTLEALARVAELESSAGRDRDLALRQSDIDEPLVLDSLTAGRLALHRVNVAGALTVRSCVVEELVVDHCTADAVLVSNSRIGRLIIRNTPRNTGVDVSESTLESLDVHSCGPTRFEGVRVSDSVTIAAMRGPVQLRRLRAATVALRSQAAVGRQRRPEVSLERMIVSETITLDDLWLASLRLDEVDVSALLLRRVRVDAPFRGTGVRCRDGLRINGMVIPGEASALLDSEVRGPVEVRGLRHEATVPAQRRPVEAGAAATPATGGTGTAELVFRSSVISSLTASADEVSPVVVELADTTVRALAVPAGPARFRLAGTSSVQEVDLGDVVFRNDEQVTGFMDRVFTRVSPGALEAVRSTLTRRRRMSEGDQLYYFTRQREAAERPLLSRLAGRALLGGVLGWGVRARNPARTLGAAMLTTAALLHLSGAARGPQGGGLLDVVGAGRALVLACALWLNVGMGAPSELKTHAWTALAVCCAGGGLLFTTLTVGIVIRKLVR
ncbi:hypothetical protein ACFCYM_30745 [Streptomyces sp. NPDC056254]|uniref:hypothetical protein n=1 Tax=Streptomyces sp. NPDC056254 TaxID=3345763 RepID=UPI0035E341E6